MSAVSTNQIQEEGCAATACFAAAYSVARSKLAFTATPSKESRPVGADTKIVITATVTPSYPTTVIAFHVIIKCETCTPFFALFNFFLIFFIYFLNFCNSYDVPPVYVVTVESDGGYFLVLLTFLLFLASLLLQTS